MPFGDWQFWVVTVVALLGVYALARQFLPKRRKGTRKRVELTVGGKRQNGETAKRQKGQAPN
mgnify:CR=1 FL=1